MNFKAYETAQKLRGGYYTPVDLASFIARWVSVGNVNRVLEPSCGDGVFFEALASENSSESLDVTAFEINDDEAKKSHARAKALGINIKITASDFLDWALTQIKLKGHSFDAVVGNPPFIRYQYLPDSFQVRAEQIFRNLGCKFTKHTNAWVPFVLASVALLRPGGRIGMVVPAEVIHVTHAQPLRTYLGAECRRIVVVDPEKLWFSDTLQGAVILLAEKRQAPSEMSQGLGIVSVRNREFVTRDPEKLFLTANAINGKTVQGKWTQALLDSSTRDLLATVEENPVVQRFAEIAQVDVGIVTGANKFFLVPKETVERYDLHEHAYPMFGRSEHCPGILYNQRQHGVNIAQGKPTEFIWLKDRSVVANKRVEEYIKSGENQKLHTRFKCRIRSPWYSVPSVYSTEIGMLKRSHNAPRLILNQVKAFTTDTAYRIRSSVVSGQKLVCCFLNPLTALSAELEGRHYGGGVLELVPSEIERLFIPIPSRIDVDLIALDKAVRTQSMMDVLAANGHVVLSRIGLEKAEQTQLFEAWMALRNRRHRIPTKLSNTKVH